MEELLLDGNDLTAESIPQLLTYLHSAVVRRVNLARNPLASGFNESIAFTLLTIKPSITALDLSGANLSDGGVQILAHALQETLSCNIADLRLNHNGISSNGAKSLSGSFEHMMSLTELHLGHNELADTGMQYIISHLSQGHLPLLQTLNVAANGLSNNVQILAKLLEHESLTSLDVAANMLGQTVVVAILEACLKPTAARLIRLNVRDNVLLQPSMAKAVAAMLLRNPWLEHFSMLSLKSITSRRVRKLDVAHADEFHMAVMCLLTETCSSPGLKTVGIESCGVGSDSMEFVVKCLHAPKLVSLSLAVNQIRSDGALALALALQQHGAIHTLDLHNNLLGLSDITAFAINVASCSTLTHLDLSANRLDDAAARACSSLLSSLAPLATLNLSENHIGALGVSALADSLGSNKTLRSLKLGTNHLGDDGVAALVAGLLENTTLSELNLEANDIGMGGIECLASLLDASPHLRSLHLHDNDFGAAGAVRLAVAVQSHSALEYLGLDGLALGDNGLRSFTHVICQNRSLTELSLKNNNVSSTVALQLRRDIERIPTLKRHGILSRNFIKRKSSSPSIQTADPKSGTEMKAPSVYSPHELILQFELSSRQALCDSCDCEITRDQSRYHCNRCKMFDVCVPCYERQEPLSPHAAVECLGPSVQSSGVAAVPAYHPHQLERSLLEKLLACTICRTRGFVGSVLHTCNQCRRFHVCLSCFDRKSGTSSSAAATCVAGGAAAEAAISSLESGMQSFPCFLHDQDCIFACFCLFLNCFVRLFVCYYF
jgi:Ran GTPase-activating protein (RanGAP) involved in mRNA processing and transport